MTPELQLIQQIRELLQRDMVDSGPVVEEYAEQFSEICHSANQRLQRCAEYLAKGMRSEAVHEASSAPSLLQLAEALNFPELKKWRNVCLDLQLPMFPPLQEDILADLRAECSREQDLAPLLRQYRRAVYQADRKECIRLLRELRERDSGNPSWPNNLRPLEEAQLPELVEQAHEALAADDLFALKAVNAELAHPQRVAPAPPDLMAQLKDALMGERRAETMRQGQTLAARIDKALDAGDGDSVDALVDAWSKLESDEAFQPTPDMRALVGRARDWQALRRKEAVAEDEFQTRVESMWALLEDGKAQEAQIRHQWDSLLAEGRSVPDRLARSVEEAISRRQAARRQRLRLVALVVLLVVVAGIGAVGALVWFGKQREQQVAVLGKLETMLKAEQYAEMQSYLESLRQNRPGIYAMPEVNHYVGTAAAELKRCADRDAKFAELARELNRIRQARFAEAEDEIRRLLAETRQVAETDEQKRTVALWEKSWQDEKAREQKGVDDALVRVSLDLRGILERRRERPFANLASEAAALAEIPPLVAQAAPLLGRATTMRVDDFNQLVAQYDAWKRDHENRFQATAAARERLAGLRDTIPGALPDVPRYFELLGEFAKEFPDEPESASYKHVLARRAVYEQAILLEGFRLPSLPPSAELAATVGKWLAGPLAGSVWEADLRECLAYAQGIQRARVALRLLPGETKDLGLKVCRIRRKGEAEWRAVYYPNTLACRTEEGEDGEKYEVYFGEVFWYDNREQEPYLTHTKRVFPNNINTREYDIRIQRQEQDNIVPHGKFLYNFVIRGMDTPQLDLHLLKGMGRTPGQRGDRARSQGLDPQADGDVHQDCLSEDAWRRRHGGHRPRAEHRSPLGKPDPSCRGPRQ